MSLEYWDKLKQPPGWALGKIQGGKLAGKTDINPMWRIQAMTETFGPCGIGWKFAVTDIKFADGANGEKLVFVQVDLYINVAGKWSAPIPGCGGDYLADTEKGKLVSNDEAVKMAITDALGNAMKYLGVAATVYSKGIDGTKYSRKSAENTKTEPEQSKAKPPQPVELKFKINLGTKEAPNYKMLVLDQVPAEQLKQIEWYAANSQNAEQKSAAAAYLAKLNES